MKRFTMTAIIAAMTTLAAAPQAAHADEVVQFEYSKSELKTAEGRDALLLRLKAKARGACNFGTLAPYSTKKGCRTDIVEQWIAAIDSPALTALSRAGETELASAQP